MGLFWLLLQLQVALLVGAQSIAVLLTHLGTQAEEERLLTVDLLLPNVVVVDIVVVLQVFFIYQGKNTFYT